MIQNSHIAHCVTYSDQLWHLPIPTRICFWNLYYSISDKKSSLISKWPPIPSNQTLQLGCNSCVLDIASERCNDQV